MLHIKSCTTKPMPEWMWNKKNDGESEGEKHNLRMHRVQCWHLRPHRRRLCDFSIFHLRWAKSGTTNFHALCCFMNPLKWAELKFLVSEARGSLTSNFYSKCSGLNSPLYWGSSGFSAGFRDVTKGKSIHFPVIVLLPGVKMPHTVQVFVKDIKLPKGSKMEWNLTSLIPPRAAPSYEFKSQHHPIMWTSLEKWHMHVYSWNVFSSFI